MHRTLANARLITTVALPFAIFFHPFTLFFDPFFTLLLLFAFDLLAFTVQFGASFAFPL
ncbi:hypothetical protein ABLU04_13810 [Acinetobacter indicus]